jgi:hypothetical protein
MSRRTNHVETRNIRASTPRLANALLWRSAAGAGRGIVGCLAQAGGQPFFNRLRRADVHAPRDVLPVSAAVIFFARKLRPPDRALLCCDIVHAYLSQPVCMEWSNYFSLGMHDFVAGREERAELFGSDFQAEPALGHLHGDCTQKIAFADVHAAMAQDRIGGCEMEIEVRQHEMV